MVKNHELFDTDFIVQSDHSQIESPRVNIQVNKHCMIELLLLDNNKGLCLFHTGSNVNLISESVIKISEYFSSLPILGCPDYTIRNTTSEINANKFIELCFQHISGKHMFVSDFLSQFSSDNKEYEPILYLTDTSPLNNALYMSQLDAICKFNYNMGQGVCTSHLFPITRSQAKLQKIAIHSLFTPSTDRPRPAVNASILHVPPAVLISKKSTALLPLNVSQPTPEKKFHRKRGLLILYYHCMKLQT